MRSSRSLAIRLVHEARVALSGDRKLRRTAGDDGYILVVKDNKAIAAEGPFNSYAVKAQMGRVKRKHPGGDTYLKIYESTPRDSDILKHVQNLSKFIPDSWGNQSPRG